MTRKSFNLAGVDDGLGLAEYEAIEGFVQWDGSLEGI